MGSNSVRAFQRPKLSLYAEDNFDGATSLPELVDFNAEFNPNHPFCKQAEVVGRKEEEDVYQIRDITMKEMKLGIDGCVSWISSALADSVPKKTGPVALYLESDVGLFIHLAALLKMKIPVLLLSARLSQTTVKHLLLTTKARSMLVSPRTKRSLGPEFNAVMTIEVVNYAFFLDDVPTGSKTARHGEGKEVPEDTNQYPLILHSSGTTGMPKPIPVSGRYIIVYAACHEFPEDMTIDWANMSTLPLYHGFGLLAPCLSLSVGMTCCFPPSSLIPAAYSTIKLLQELPAGSLMTVPSIMDDMLGREEDLTSLKFVAIGGGQLNPDTAIAMAEKSVPLLNHYGVTEIGALAPIFCPGIDYDWHYLRIRTDLGLRLEAIDKEEAAGDSHPGQGPSRFKLVGFPVDSSERFEIQDEMETRPNVNRVEIKLLGRRDDMIALKTGEKVLARRLEDLLNSDLHIKTSVCLGQGYLEVVVLIEPSSSLPLDHDEAVDHVWALIKAVNPQLDQHARVSSKTAIILKPKEKVIPRSDKGSIMRRETHDVFKEEIEAAYAALGLDSLGLVEFSLDARSIESSIQEMAHAVLGGKKQSGASSHGNGHMTDDDFFEGGMDSLQAVRLARYLDAAVRRVVSWKPEPEGETMKGISAEFIYRYPSVRLLSAVLSRQLWGGEAGKEAKEGQLDHQAEISKLLDEATKAMDADSPGDESEQVAGERQVILLTGSTGSLGAQVLGLLAHDKRVGRIICVNRKSKPAENDQQKYDIAEENAEAEAEARQRRILSEAGIHLTASAWSKIHLLHGPLGTHFDQLAHSITHIIHLAWPMDFKRGVQSFTPHINALGELIKLARAASRYRLDRGKVRLLFSSSIAVIRYFGGDTARTREVMVPEKILPEARLMAMGYAEAKWICEQMLDFAKERYGVEIEPITVRVGQLSGAAGRGGSWKAAEHIPALLRASQVLATFPDLKGTMSWLPVDIAAKCLLEILFQPGAIHSQVVHLENPVRQSMHDFVVIASRELGVRNIVPYTQWLDLADKAACFDSLLGFFRKDFLAMASGELVLDTQQSRTVSRTLRGTSAVGRDLIVDYINQWREAGFLK